MHDYNLTLANWHDDDIMVLSCGELKHNEKYTVVANVNATSSLWHPCSKCTNILLICSS